jgi:hypothetical protein
MMTQEEAEKAQRWAGMDGATAYHLIDRHAGDWSEIGLMMDAWLRANGGSLATPAHTPAPPAASPA